LKFSRYFKGHLQNGNIAVRILRGQPGSVGLKEIAPDSRRKACQQRAFVIRRPVSVLPISRYEYRIRRKSLANTANIPVFGRRRPETGFDHALRGDVGSPVSRTKWPDKGETRHSWRLDSGVHRRSRCFPHVGCRQSFSRFAIRGTERLPRQALPQMDKLTFSG
jgi:hypothetical protein